MSLNRIGIAWLLWLAMNLAAPGVQADNSQDFGDYVIHYNAFRSDTLEPEVAKQYDLIRRNNRIIVNIAVLKKVLDTTGKPTAAKVEGHASNLTGQLKTQAPPRRVSRKSSPARSTASGMSTSLDGNRI